MCGIVGLYVKEPQLEPMLGAMLTPMLVAMGERGPDSAGVAIFDDGLDPESMKWSLRNGTSGYDWNALAASLETAIGSDVSVRPAAEDAVLVARGEPDTFRDALTAIAPEVDIVAAGSSLEVYKDTGDPATVCARYGIAERGGLQALGHTRMATESAVTTAHSHPFAAGTDLCLVHNGSFSNYASVRRRLVDHGVRFDTDNDSEVAARYLAWRLSRGSDLQTAIESLMDTLDGFYTLLIGTSREFAVVRDAFACKPAIIAETDSYVAMASEYRALAALPGIEDAAVFEPMPEDIHIWSR